MSRRVAIAALLAVAADSALLHFWKGSTELLYGIRIILGTGIMAALIRSGTPRETLGLVFRPQGSDFRWIGLCCLIVIPLYGILAALLYFFPTGLGVDFAEGRGAIQYVWTSLLLAPVAEEILYRGLVVPALRENLPGWAVILASGLLFYLLHLSYGKDWRLLHYIPAGMILAWAFLATHKLWVPVLLHFLGNMLMAVDDVVRLIGE